MEERRKDEELRALFDLQSKMESLWWHHRNDRVLERLNELETFRRVITQRAQNDAVFTDDQVERIKEIIADGFARLFDERFDNSYDNRTAIHAGHLTFRSVLWTLGAVGAAALSALLVYIGLKK